MNWRLKGRIREVPEAKRVKIKTESGVRYNSQYVPTLLRRIKYQNLWRVIAEGDFMGGYVIIETEPEGEEVQITPKTHIVLDRNNIFEADQ